MIYIFHGRTRFLRQWLIVLVWNNSSGNLFMYWLIHTLHGLSLGHIFLMSFILSTNMCVLPIKIKLSLSLPTWTHFIFTHTLYGEALCAHRGKRGGFIANGNFFYQEEKCTLGTFFRILVLTQWQKMPKWLPTFVILKQQYRSLE